MEFTNCINKFVDNNDNYNRTRKNGVITNSISIINYNYMIININTLIIKKSLFLTMVEIIKMITLSLIIVFENNN